MNCANRLDHVLERLTLPTEAPNFSANPTLRSDLAQRLRQHAFTSRTSTTPRIPFAQLARLVGVSRRTVYHALTAHVNPVNEILLHKVLDLIESGAFKFERHKQRWRATGSLPLIIRPRRRPYPRRRVYPDDVLRRLRDIARDGCLIKLSKAVGLPYPVVRQAVGGAMSINTFNALVAFFRTGR